MDLKQVIVKLNFLHFKLKQYDLENYNVLDEFFYKSP